MMRAVIGYLLDISEKKIKSKTRAIVYLKGTKSRLGNREILAWIMYRIYMLGLTYINTISNWSYRENVQTKKNLFSLFSFQGHQKAFIFSVKTASISCKRYKHSVLVLKYQIETDLLNIPISVHFHLHIVK